MKNNVSDFRPVVWFVGGEDVRMRIPMLLALKELGFSVAAVGSEDSTQFDHHGVEYYQYQLVRGISPLADLNSCRQLTELFRKHRPDVVHAFDTKPSMLVPIAASLAGICKVIKTVTGMGYVYSSKSPVALAIRPFYRFLQKLSSRFADATIFQNTDDQAYFQSTNLIEADKSFLVKSSGVDLELLYRNCSSKDEISALKIKLDHADGLVVLMVSRLVKYKGVLEYLEAARLIKSSNPECQFYLVGPLASEGSQGVSEKFIESHRDAVSWLGTLSNVPALLAVSDIFVLPSYYREGVPRVLLEAGAVGLPLITTDMPGCRDVVRDGIEGLIVEPRDSESLAEAIKKLLASESLRCQMGQFAKQRVQAEFSLNKVAEAYADIYSELLGGINEQ